MWPARSSDRSDRVRSFVVMPRVIVRMKGGLGNQLFCYAAARRLAMHNGAELVIDDVSGFARDRRYSRQYALDHFSIPCRKATPQERMEPFEQVRRRLARWMGRVSTFGTRGYVEEERPDFDSRLLGLKVNGTVYLDGLWQSSLYFEEIEGVIRQDLRIRELEDKSNREMADKIRAANSVCVHVRWFDHYAPLNLEDAFYERAANEIEQLISDPHYFVFTNDRGRTAARLKSLTGKITYVGNNAANDVAHADLWLMTQCKHFIIANSTFSWWGAWLSTSIGKIIMCPPPLSKSGIQLWSSASAIPLSWLQIPA